MPLRRKTGKSRMQSNIYMGERGSPTFVYESLERMRGVGYANAERPTEERAQPVQRSDDAGAVPVL